MHSEVLERLLLLKQLYEYIPDLIAAAKRERELQKILQMDEHKCALAAIRMDRENQELRELLEEAQKVILAMEPGYKSDRPKAFRKKIEKVLK